MFHSWDMFGFILWENMMKIPMDLGTVPYFKETTMMEKWFNPQRPEMGWKWKLRWTLEMIYWDRPEITVLHVISTYALWSALSRYRHKHHSFAKKSCGARHLLSELLSMPCKPSWSRRWIPGCWCSTSVLLDFSSLCFASRVSLPKKIIPSPY